MSWLAVEHDSTWHSRRRCGRWPHDPGGDWKSSLRDDVRTLAQYLGSQGCDTAGFVANLAYCGRESGLAQGVVHNASLAYHDIRMATDVYDDRRQSEDDCLTRQSRNQKGSDSAQPEPSEIH
jgi:hypothetical protein